MPHSWMALSGFLLCAAAVAYSLAVFVAIRMRIKPCGAVFDDFPAVSLLKPLCGAEPETYECLRSFCDQDYPQFQVIFGVSDPGDPVIAIVHQLQREFPRRDLQLTVDCSMHGTSRKVSNLINMMPSVRHEYLVLSDSDCASPAIICAAWSRLLPIRAWVSSPALIADCRARGCGRCSEPCISTNGSSRRCASRRWRARARLHSATIAMRRCVLDDIGGFAPIVNQLADDYRLGEMTRQLGLRTVLSHIYVETYVSKSSLLDLIRHELRWLRTIRGSARWATGCRSLRWVFPWRLPEHCSRADPPCLSAPLQSPP